MHIPKQLEEKLEGDAALLGAVKSSIAEFEPLIKSSGLPFFPEYTDHGPEHIEHVLQTADALINNESRQIITPGDAATLVLAILLHDAAMHLSEESFLYLIQPGEKHQSVAGFDDKSWSFLWTDFVSEANRFDGRKLTALFGDTTPVRPLPSDSMLFTKRDRLLVGEFLRRHHPRLAHEIALFGVPTPQKDRLRLIHVPEYLADLAGLVARSHGLPLRSCFGYLESKYSLREFKGIHAVFHMALVRVADYLQTDAERAPKQALKIKQLRSPVSQGEWKAHHAIRDIRQAEDDPEAIFIDARPDDVKTYLRIKELLGGIQTELDASWAAIGEVYGRFANEGLDKLGLTLRRVRSNLDDETAFSRTVNYVPVKATFQAAGAELLKLLIGPLYGNGPEFGVRELLQNAVDAVLELQKYQEMHSEYKQVELTNQPGDVVIALDKEPDGFSWITVSDRGVGMTASIIHDYYLKVGASFRNSEMWHQSYDDADGKSTVSRSGRFGVGVLASFLLGREVHVSTRHISATETEGIRFTASVDTEAIELQRFARPVGTTIRIQVEDEIADKLKRMSVGSHGLSWDWYCLEHPSVVRLVNKIVQPQNFFVPEVRGTLISTKWHRLIVEGYGDFQWTYSTAPSLTCNGIIVTRSGGQDYNNFGSWMERNTIPSWGPHFLSSVPTGYTDADGLAVYKHSDANNQYRLNMPNVSVFDPDARLPLNLQRTGLTQENYPFQAELLDSVIKDFIAYTLVVAPTSPPDSTKGMYVYDQFPGKGEFSHPAIDFNPLSESFAPFWFYTDQGVSLADKWHFSHTGLERLLIYFDKRFSASDLKEAAPLPLPKIKAHQAMLRINYQQNPTSIPSYSEGRYLYGSFSFLYVNSIAVVGQRTLLPRAMAEAQLSGEKVHQVEWESEHCVLLCQGICPEESGDILLSSGTLEEYYKQGTLEAFVSEVYLSDQHPKIGKSLVAEAWQRIVGDPIIPYDLKERRRKFAKAYGVLDAYISAYESV